MRGRPDIDLQVPPVVHPGQVVDVRLLVASRSDTPIDFIDLTFEGDEVLTLQPDGQPDRKLRNIVRSIHRLRGEGVLAEGDHPFEVTITIPQDAPASYLGVRVLIRYELRIHVSIPWWPDLRETYEVLVEERPSSRPKSAPAHDTSARGSEPFVELALADTSFGPNDEISGAFAVGNLARRDGASVDLALVAYETAKVEGDVRRAEQFRYNAPNVYKTPADGGEVPFRFRVPKDVVPSFESAGCRLSWAVHAVLRPPWSSPVLCDVPVTIRRYVAPRDASRARLEVGAARWRRLWSEIGERRRLVLAEGRLALAGSRGEVQIEVALDQSDDDPALVATLRYPTLGLGLRVTPQLVVMLPTPLELAFPGCKVEHREADQARAFLGERLASLARAFKSVRIDDTRTVVRSPGAGFDESGLGVFLDDVTALADALVEAMERCPPPAAMKDALPAWRDFAAVTGARLSPGGMSLMAASVDGAVFEVATLFGPRAEVTGTSIQLQLDPPLDYRVDLASEASFGAAPAGARELALALQASVRRLAIEQHALTVEVDGPTLDPADLRPRMVEMLVLARRLRGERTPGPYR